MSTVLSLQAEPRPTQGSREARRSRRAGRIPANVYGHGEGNAALLLDAHELELALAKPGNIFELKIGGKSENALIKEVQYDTFGQHVLHVDFARIDLSEEIEVEVNLELRGTPAGVTQGGNILVHHNTIWVRCIASAVPSVLEVDVSSIEIGHALHAGEIPLPAGIKLDTHKMEAETQIIGVLAPRAAEPEPGEGDEEPVEGVAEGEKAPEGDKPEGEDKGGA